MMRHDGRNVQDLRKITIETNVLKHPEGSVLISFGDTKVICAATVEETVPPFLKGTGKGWVTAEYSMLPRATNTRNRRESSKGKLSGRTMEIQRLIGRSLRAVVDLEKLGERSIIVDCDVIQADGGTRTASITGAFVALRLAIEKLLQKKVLANDPIKEHLAAISVGILADGTCVTDLDYHEDVAAEVDMNLVMTESGKFVEIQGTGEEATFDGEQLNEMLVYGKTAIESLIFEQKNVLLSEWSDTTPEPTEKTIVIATRNAGKAEEFRSLFAKEGYTVKTLFDYPEIPDVEEKSDAANNAKLLFELTDVADEERTAQFHCTLVFAEPNKESLVVEAEWPGRIGRIPKGENGFGYDPLFIPDGYTQTAAEISSEEKNNHSHRGLAMAKLSQVWQGWLEGVE